MVIDSYEFGKIVIDGALYEKDLVIYPDKIEPNWWRESGHLLQLKDLQSVLNTITSKQNSVNLPAERLEKVVVIGTGAYGEMKIDPEIVKTFKLKNIELICETTNNACEIYNKLSKENNSIIAALHLTC